MNKKKIAINMSHYWTIWWYGVVFDNVINRLLCDDHYEFYLLSTIKKSLPQNISQRPNIHWVISNPRNVFFYRLFTQAQLLKKYDVDVFFTCDQIVPLKKVCKYVSTIHDLFFWKTYYGLKVFKLLWRSDHLWIYQLLRLDKFFAKNSDIIFTPSNDSRQDIIKEFNINNSKIKTINWWINHLKDVDLSKDISSLWDFWSYILFPLCTDIHDHFLVKLWEKILDSNLVDNIVYRNCSSNEWKMLKYDGRNTHMIVINKRISDSEKTYLIKNAKMCLYVSEYEWFWLVPLECIFYKKPLIYRIVWSLPEIVWDVWIWIKWFDIDEWMDQIECIITKKKIIDVQAWYKKIISYNRDNTVSEMRKYL